MTLARDSNMKNSRGAESSESKTPWQRGKIPRSAAGKAEEREMYRRKQSKEAVNSPSTSGILNQDDPN